MQTLKSTMVIAVLLGTLYGVYIVLGQPPQSASRAAKQHAHGHNHDHDHEGPQIEFATPVAASPQLAVETHGLGATSPATTSPASLSAPGALSSPASPLAPPPATSAYAPPPTPTYTTPVAPPSAYAPPAEAAPPPMSTYGAPSTASNPLPAAAPSAYGANSYSATLIPPAAEGSPAGVAPAVGLGGQGYATPSSNVTDIPAQPTAAMTAYSWRELWNQAENLVAQDKLRAALALLSPYYNHRDTPPEQREALKPWLDALATRVIYSKEHLLEAPYDARAKETLFQVADRCQVPWQVLHSINHDVVSDPELLVVGTRLKLIHGPFHAHVSTSRQELTVYLNDLYAGRFPISFGNEPPKWGTHKVTDKSRDRTYYGPDSRTLAASDPTNPYGGYWLELGMNGSIHGSPTAPSGEALGSVSLSPQDAKDVFGMLSVGSLVTVE